MRLGRMAAAALLWLACGGRTFDGSSAVGEDVASTSTGGRDVLSSTGGRSTGSGGRKGSSGSGGERTTPKPTGGTSGMGGSGSGGKSAPGDAGKAGDGGSGFVPDGMYDPNEVYLAGTLAEGACYRDAIAHPRTPNMAAVGFDCDTRFVGIDPRTQRFVFFITRFGDIRRLYGFVPDGDGHGQYPQDPYGNDITLIDPICETPTAYFLDPGGGPIIYQCYGSSRCRDNGCRYYDEQGNEVTIADGYYLVHLGLKGSALVRSADADQEWAVKDPDGVVHPFALDWIPNGFRAHPGGFWVLRGKQRMSINFDGSLTSDGTYPQPPSFSEYSGECAFEGDGALVCFGRSTEVVFEDHIIRAELDASEAEVIYSEETESLVDVHISYLVTGP